MEFPVTSNTILTNSNSGFEDRPAGKPSDRPAGSVTPSTGRRSRRNSFSEESQLTWENFGGSTDNLHLIHRDRDKDVTLNSAKVAAEAREARVQVSLRSSRSPFEKNKLKNLEN